MYFCLSCKICWTNYIIKLMLKINMESDQFIQDDDLWAFFFFYGFDLDHAIADTKIFFFFFLPIYIYLELIIRSELEPNYAVMQYIEIAINYQENWGCMNLKTNEHGPVIRVPRLPRPFISQTSPTKSSVSMQCKQFRAYLFCLLFFSSFLFFCKKSTNLWEY